jgi:hypothetical protein
MVSRCLCDATVVSQLLNGGRARIREIRKSISAVRLRNPRSQAEERQPRRLLTTDFLDGLSDCSITGNTATAALPLSGLCNRSRFS